MQDTEMQLKIQKA